MSKITRRNHSYEIETFDLSSGEENFGRRFEIRSNINLIHVIALWNRIYLEEEGGIDLESKGENSDIQDKLHFSTPSYTYLRYKPRYTFQLKRIEFSKAWLLQGRNLNCSRPINTYASRVHPFTNPLLAQDFLITPSPAANLFVHEKQSREETVSHRSTILLSLPLPPPSSPPALLPLPSPDLNETRRVSASRTLHTIKEQSQACIEIYDDRRLRERIGILNR